MAGQNLALHYILKLCLKIFSLPTLHKRTFFKDAERTQQTKRMAKVLILFLALTAIISASGFKFNTPRILLPVFDDVRVNYTLSILEAGCFDFT